MTTFPKGKRSSCCSWSSYNLEEKKEKKRKKKKRIITVLRAKRTLLCESYAEPGTGEAVDGWVEAHITTALPPHAGTETRRRNLYQRNHVHTSCGKSDGPKNREGQESLCWWLCSERVRDPGGENNKIVTHRCNVFSFIMV